MALTSTFDFDSKTDIIGSKDDNTRIFESQEILLPIQLEQLKNLTRGDRLAVRACISRAVSQDFFRKSKLALLL